MAPQESSRETGGPWRARSALDVPSVLSFFCLFPWAPPFSWEEFTGIFWSCYIQKKKPGPSITFLSYKLRGSLGRGRGMHQLERGASSLISPGPRTAIQKEPSSLPAPGRAQGGHGVGNGVMVSHAGTLLVP